MLWTSCLSGTNDGVMKYMGEIMRQNALEQYLIGIAPYGGLAQQGRGKSSHLIDLNKPRLLLFASLPSLLAYSTFQPS